jgi:hypothetical protein
MGFEEQAWPGLIKCEYKGHLYTFLGLCRIKTADGWIDGAMYRGGGEEVYVRERRDFLKKFKPLMP